MLATEQTTGGMLRATEILEIQAKAFKEVPSKIYELLFPDAVAKHQYSIRKTSAIFADMWIEKLECIEIIEHLV